MQNLIQKEEVKRASIDSVSNKKIVFLDEDGDDPNATLKIGTTDPTIFSAEFAGSEDKGNLETHSERIW